MGLLPTTWKVLRAKVLYQERKELSETGEEELLSASHLTGITKRSEKNVGMFLAETLEGYKKVHPDDAVVNTMWAWMGALGVSQEYGVISPSYGIYRPIGDSKDPRFYDYVFRSAPFVAEVNRRSKGVWSSRLRLYPNDFLTMRLPYPSLSEQRSIADFLDYEVARIDQLIEKKNLFISLTAQRIDALVDEVFSNSSVPRIRFENVVRRVQRPVVLSEHDELIRLGLFNRGRGIFKKPAADEEGMGDSSFHFVRDGDLILSGQFAWEGAVALATEDEDGCVVSHRYPVFKGRDGINTAYLLGLLRSGFGDFLLNESSRGSAGRNRPLNTWRLGKEKIPIPSRELQETVDRALAFERQLKKKTEHSLSLLTEARAALITAAVTGQINATAWGKQGQTDRRLDEIEEAMQA
ncbi:restriction endonuclease subunit S [Roseobacter sp. TSBP12]|nr:restriction endonuclease subunit S [Roseobacter sp. TSBP12]